MKNNITYYIFQGRKSASEAFLIVIGISIALSCVAGIGYFTNTFQSAALLNSNRQILDFHMNYDEIEYEETYIWENHDFNWSLDEYSSFQTDMVKAIESNSDLDIIDSLQFRIYGAWDIAFYKDYSDLPQSDHPYGEDIYFSMFNLFEVDQNFYESDRFDDYFSIIEGTYPQNDNEILVDIQFAKYMNLSIGSGQSLRLADISPPGRFNPNTYDFKDIYSAFQTSNLSVSGYYACKNPVFAFGNAFFQTDYIFDDKTFEITSRNDFAFEYPFAATPLFTSYNKSNLVGNSGVGKMIDEFSFSMRINLDTYDGVGFFIDRSLIDYDHLTTFTVFLSDNTALLNEKFDGKHVLYNFLGTEIASIRHNLTLIKILMQIANIPIIIFALYIGVKSIVFEQKNRLEEFAKLRSKGIPDNMLRDQIFIEGLFIGITSSIIGSLAGFGIYSLVNSFLLRIFKSVLYVNNLVFVPSIGPIVFTFLIGLIITQAASILSVLYINRLPTSKIISMLNNYNVENVVDESIFEKKVRTSSKIKLDLDSKKSKSASFLDKSEIGTHQDQGLLKVQVKEVQPKKKTELKNNSNIYKGEVQGLKRRHIGMIVLAVIFLSIPIAYILLLACRNLFTGNVKFFIENIMVNDIVLLVFLGITLLSPIILSIILIQLLTKNNPRFFGRLSQKISKLVIKSKSKLCARNMLSRKQYHSLMVIIAVYLTLFTFTNVFLNSYSKSSIIQNNIYTGADSRLEYPEIQFIDNMFYTGLEFNTHIRNFSDILNLESGLKNLTDNSNFSIVNNVMTSYKEPLTINDHSEVGSKLFTTNLTQYYHMITENSKFEPTKGDFAKLYSVVSDSLGNADNICPAIINSKFVENRLISLGDQFNISHKFYNYKENNLEYQEIPVKVVAIIDTLPGFYNTYDNLEGVASQDFMVIDISYVNLDMDNLPGFELIQFVDLNNTINMDNTDVTKKLESVTLQYRNIDDLQFYNNKWDDNFIDFNDDSNNIYLIYYIEFSIFGILIVFSVSIVFQIIRKNRRYDEGIMLSHGMGKSGINSLFFGDLTVIFSISTIVGVFGGFLYSAFFLQGYNLLINGSSSIKTLIFINPYELVGIILLLPFLSYALFLFSKYIVSKRKMVEVYHNF